MGFERKKYIELSQIKSISSLNYVLQKECRFIHHFLFCFRCDKFLMNSTHMNDVMTNHVVLIERSIKDKVVKGRDHVMNGYTYIHKKNHSNFFIL